LNLPFYHRYVDDIILTPHLIRFLTFWIFLTVFTIGYNLPKNMKKIKVWVSWIFCWGQQNYRLVSQKTFSGRFLSYLSNHSLYHKIRTIYNVEQSCYLIPTSSKRTLNLIHQVFLDNSYSLEFNFKVINARLKNLFNKLSIHTNNKSYITIVSQKIDEKNIAFKKYFVMLYIRNISEITASLINKSVFTVGFRWLNKINKFV